MTATLETATIPEFDAARVRQMLASGEALLLDVREPDEHRRESIAGSSLTPTSGFDPRRLPQAGDRWIILHCKSGTRAREAARRCIDAGATHIACVAGGIEGWKAAGLPVIRDTRAPLPVMQQTQIAMGSIVVISTALGAFWHPLALGVTAFIGCGMIFAGLTGNCGMATLIGQLPWNRTNAGSSAACDGAQACSLTNKKG